MNKPWKMVLLLLGIYLAGGVTGAFVMLKVGHDMRTRRPMPEQWTQMQLQRLTERLGLSEAQKEQIQPIVKRNMDELNRLRAYTMAESKTVIERMEREVAEKLTPEQRTQYEQLNKEMRERARRFMQNRAPGGPGGPRFDRERNRDWHRNEPGRPAGEPPPPPEKPPGT